MKYTLEQLHTQTQICIDSSFTTYINNIQQIYIDSLFEFELNDSDIEILQSMFCYENECYEWNNCFINWIHSEFSECMIPYLIKQNLNIRGLIVVCMSMMKMKNKLSLIGASLYLSLLHSSTASLIFNEVVLRNVMYILKNWAHANINHSFKNNKSKKNKKSTDKTKKDIMLSQSSNPFEDDEENIVNDTEYLLEEELIIDIKQLLHSLQTLLNPIKPKLMLNKYTDIITFIVEALVEVTRTQQDKIEEVNTPSAISYVILHDLLSNCHGKSEYNFNVMLKHLLPNTLMTFVGLVTSNVPKYLIGIHSRTLQFIIDVSKSNPHYHKSLTYFIQHLCIRSPDRSEYRKVVHRSILTILSSIPILLNSMYTFLYKLSKNSKTLYRLLSVELITYILECPEIMNGSIVNNNVIVDGKSEVNEQNESMSTNETDEKQPLNELDITMSEEDTTESSTEQQTIILQFLTILISRCSDKIATVRAKSILHLGMCIKSCQSNETMKSQINHLFTSSIIPQMNDSVPMTPASKSQFSFLTTPFNDNTINNTTDINITSTTNLNLSRTDGINSILTILHRRASDSKPIVRRSVIETLEIILCIEQNMNQFDIQILYDGCCDTSVAIRKQSMISLSNLFEQFYMNSILSNVWIGSIFPMINDTENSIQEKVLYYVNQLIIEPLINYLKNDTKNQNKIKTNDFNNFYIFTLFNNLDEEMYHYFQTIIIQMIKKNIITIPMIKIINKYMICDEKCIWLIVEMIGKHISTSIDIELLYHQYNKIISGNITNISTIISILTTLSSTCQQLTIHQCAHIANYIVNCLMENNNNHISIIKVQIILMKNLCTALVTNQLNVEDKLSVPCWENEVLANCQQHIESYIFKSNIEETILIHSLYTIGELLLHTNIIINNHLLTMIQTLLDTHLPTNQCTISSTIRAYSYITLGKICLTNENIAKKNITLFIKELENGSDIVIRNNILIIMCDLCRTYTSIVDDYINSITTCLKDSNTLIRRHTIMIMIQLLTEDYIKWKNNIFYRYLITLIDLDTNIRKLAETSLTNMLIKSSNRYYTSFIECIFYLNGCTSHSIYNQTNEKNNELFQLVGSIGTQQSNQRFIIYRYLLTHINDEHKFSLINKMCNDILGSIIDGSMIMNNTSYNVIQDTLIILASSYMKLTLHKTIDDGDELDDDIENVKHVQISVAKGKLLSKLVKKNTMESIVPILIELKQSFEQQQSPLLRYLMLYLKELLHEYKNELQDIIHDKQLLQELQFDLRHMKKDKIVRLSMTPQLNTTTPAKRNVIQRTQSTPIQSTPSKSYTKTPMTVSKTPINSMLGSLMTPNNMISPIVSFVSPRLRRTSSNPTPLKSTVKLTSINEDSALQRTRSQPPVPLFDTETTSTTPDIIMSSIDINKQTTPSKWNISIPDLQETCEQLNEISIKKRKCLITPIKNIDTNDQDDEMEDQENTSVVKVVPIKSRSTRTGRTNVSRVR